MYVVERKVLSCGTLKSTYCSAHGSLAKTQGGNRPNVCDAQGVDTPVIGMGEMVPR